MTDPRHFSWTSCALALFLILAMPSAMALEEGKPAPDFEITTTDGKLFKSTDAKGEVIVVNLWASLVHVLPQEMPVIETYYQRHKAEGVRIIAVNMDEASEDQQGARSDAGFTATPRALVVRAS